MEIIQTTTITLSEEEKKAIQTIIDAHETCAANDCFECEVCPLCLSNGVCIALYCEDVRRKDNKNDN